SSAVGSGRRTTAQDRVFRRSPRNRPPFASNGERREQIPGFRSRGSPGTEMDRSAKSQQSGRGNPLTALHVLHRRYGGVSEGESRKLSGPPESSKLQRSRTSCNGSSAPRRKTLFEKIRHVRVTHRRPRPRPAAIVTNSKRL